MRGDSRFSNYVSQKRIRIFIIIEELESTIDRKNEKVSDISHALD